jgi:formamidopyrimidine-DNA glycosylase
MPELPDIQIYLEHLERRISGVALEQIRLASPFLLRTVAPGLEEVSGRSVSGLRRIGKRIVIELEGDLFLVIHLMISGRFRWKEKGAKIPGRLGLAAFDFQSGTLLLTEASKKKRASLHIIAGEEALRAMDPGGLELLEAGSSEFRETLTRENRTLKRALTDPRLFSGIGNAFSDEILHAARLSPVKLTSRLDDAEIKALHKACVAQLHMWIDILRKEAGDRFPEKVTAFRKGMAVHGKFDEPCPVCGSRVQRILYAANEANYCAPCQTGGKLLADRVLSKLLKKDWPRTLEELELRRGRDSGRDEEEPRGKG